MTRLWDRDNQHNDSRAKIRRWYKGFCYKGDPSKLVEQISRHIQQQGLEKFLPLLRLEKGAKSNKVFYFFIAFESEKIGSIPAQIEYLLQLPFFKTPAVKGANTFNYDQIKNMIGLAHDVRDYTSPIPYQSQPKPISENPLILLDSKEILDLDSQAISQLSREQEHFLYWLSASGNGTWESFKKTCEILNLSEPRRILRRLKLLQHIKVSQDGSNWQVNPSSLLELPTNAGNGDRAFLLYGQRSSKLLKTLEIYGSLEKTIQPRGEAPPCICFNLPQQITPENLIQKIQSHGYFIQFTSHLEIQNLETWCNSLQVIPGLVPAKFTLKKFNGREFVDCVFQNQTGFYQFFTLDTNSQLRYSFFYDQNVDRWLQGDWYGLRFFAISSMGINLRVHYSVENRQLIILLAERWAETYETLLVMASGLLPKYREGGLIYQGISRELATAISTSLNIILTEA